MPCLLLIALLASPRIALFLMWLLSNYLQRAYQGILLPLLGFIFLPWTTIAYAWLVNSHRPIEGLNLIVLIVAIIVDLGGIGGGYRQRRS